MKSTTSGITVRRLTVTLTIAVLGTLLQPAIVMADTTAEIKKEIMDGNAYVRKNNKDVPGSYSEKGSVEFWSSGGLMQHVPANPPTSEYVSFSLTPKHIHVVVLKEGESAVAMYYSEGSFHEKGSDPVTHYMTRITEAYVKEGKGKNAKWVVRAAHYSPIAAGSGTKQTAIID